MSAEDAHSESLAVVTKMPGTIRAAPFTSFTLLRGYVRLLFVFARSFLQFALRTWQLHTFPNSFIFLCVFSVSLQSEKLAT